MELALLQHSQQFGLRRSVQVADFVEKNRSAVRELELAAPRRDGAGERALLVAEQLALDQFSRNAAQLTFTKAPSKTAGLVNVSGQQFLARSGFAGQEHRASDRAAMVACSITCSNAGLDPIIFAGRPFTKSLVLVAQAGLFVAFFSARKHAVPAQRLFEKIVSPGAVASTASAIVACRRS